MRYFFHITNGHGPVVDEEGSELADIDAVRLEAAQTMYDLVKSEAPEHQHEISIEVEDENKKPVLSAVLTFEIKALN
jgi:hypothetical protein